MRWFLLLLAGVLATVPRLAAQTYTLSYTSDPGDYIGQGQSASYTEADGTSTMQRNADNGFSFGFDHATLSGVWWYVDLAAADNVELSAGNYPGAQRYPFQDPGHPGMNWSGSGRGCNTITGSFTVSSITFDFFGVPRRVDASLEQHCEGATPALHGSLDYDFGGMGPANLVPHGVLATSRNLIYEYEFDGTLVRRYPVLGSLPGGGRQTSLSEVLRDLAIGPDRTVYGFTGTFDPYLSIWVPATGSWSQVTEPDWAIVNNGSYGGIATAGNFVFVADNLTNSNGILRYDTTDQSWTRFALGANYIDLALGWDGLLYALDGNETDLDKYDPATLAPVGSIVLGSAVRGVAAAADGRVYGVGWSSGRIYRFSATGAVEASVAAGLGSLGDIDVDRDGRIVVGSWLNGWGATTTALGPVAGFLPPGGSNNTTFVAFAVRGYAANQIFLDGFESGDTAVWSAAAP